MEQIVVELSPFTRACRSVPVSHHQLFLDQDLGRALEAGEHVLVHDPSAGEHFRAVVVDVYVEPADTTYRLDLGGRITAEEAAEWAADRAEPGADEDRLSTRDIVELLAELRRSERDIAAALAELHGH